MKNNLVIISVFLSGLFLATSAQGQGSLVGAWQLQERVVSGGPNEGTNTDPDLHVNLFTDRHYSVMRNAGDRPDPVPEGQTPTDKDRLAAFATFRADMGTYELAGSKIIFHNMLSRDPEAVGETSEFEYRFEGDKLVIIGTNDLGVVARNTYIRLD